MTELLTKFLYDFSCPRINEVYVKFKNGLVNSVSFPFYKNSKPSVSSLIHKQAVRRFLTLPNQTIVRRCLA